MKNCLANVLLFLLFTPAAVLHASDCNAMAGGVAVSIPAPGQFLEVGGDKRDFFEYMVPSRNRLLCAFVPADLLPRLKNPASGMGRYMVVEVSRQLDEKNAEVTPATFEQVVSSLKQQLSSTSELNQTVQSTSDEVSSKLKAIDKAKDVAIDQPTPLGTLFQMRDAYAFAMVEPVSSGGATARMINASVLLRIRNRLVFAYLYSDANDETSLKWIETMAEAWAREILTANVK